MSPKISVVVPTYDRPKYIEALLQALRLQTFKGFEVIISDDGSFFMPYEVIKSFERQLDIKYIWQQDKPWNMPEAKNLGIKLSYAKVILLFDDDTIPCQRCLENHYKRHLKEDRIMVFGQLMGCPGLKPSQVKNYLLSEYPRGATPRFRPIPKNFSVKRKEILAINGFDLDYSGHYGYDDFDFTKRLADNGVKAVQAPECEALALIAHSGHTKYSKDTKRNFELHQRKIKEGKIVCKRGLVMR